jgi:transposase-like protein
MAGRKGMKHYPESFKMQIKQEHDAGASLNSLCKKYGISFYSAASWCELRPEVNRRKMTPLKRGRPSKSNQEDLTNRVKRLEMENELLRNFLRELERK